MNPLRRNVQRTLDLLAQTLSLFITLRGFEGRIPHLLATLIGIALSMPPAAQAQVPGIITYQGTLDANGGRFQGTGHFKFALVNDGIPTLTTFWRNDGSVAGTEPANHLSVEVDQGIFTIALGDTNLPTMAAVPASVFTNNGVHLRIWFREGTAPGAFTLLSPDQRISSVGYSFMTANVADGAISTAKIADAAVGSAKIAGLSIQAPHLALGSVTTPKLADGAVTTTKIAANAVSSAQVADNSLTSADISDVLNLRELVLETAAGANRIELSGSGESGVLRMNHGLIGRFLELEGTANGGFLRLFDKLGGELTGQTTVELGSSNLGGYARLFQDNGSAGIHLGGQNGAQPGGSLLIYRSSGLGVVLQGQLGNGGGQIEVRDAGSDPRVQLRGENGTFQLLNEAGNGVTLRATGDTGELVALNRVGVANSVDAPVLQASLGKDENGGLIRTRDEKDNTTTLIASGTEGGSMRVYRGVQNGQLHEGVVIDGDDGNGGAIAVKDGNGTSTLKLIGAQTASTGSRLEMYQASGGTATVVLDGEVGTGGGGYLQLRNSGGVGTITLDSDVSGEGRITTQVLQITGGSDLSEKFNINPHHTPLKPGMIVSIDPTHPGELMVSGKAYDRTVAGVLSGAGGVKPGMLMGQAGTKADGSHPVALTGRVYCLVDASQESIAPGDLLTTSELPGHGMKALDHDRAQGAIIGKAMTGLKSGQGLVLVLISLQ